MVNLEIDAVNKTIKFKNSILLMDIPKVLSEILLGWEYYTLIFQYLVNF